MAPSARSLGAVMLATAAASPLNLGELRAAVGGDVALRVLPIGDAATYGTDEAPNGYRAELAKLLEEDGNKVEIVGSTLHGDEPVEASAKGETVDELLTRAEIAVPGFLPNVVVLNAGTADCEQGADGKEVGDKIVKILELVWDGSIYASVVLATSPLPDETEVQQCVNDVNNKFRNLVKEHQDLSHKVVLVDLDGAKPIETDDNGIPTKEGYKAVAKMLFDGVDDAGERGWLQAPEELPEDAPEPEEETSASLSVNATSTTVAVEKRQEETPSAVFSPPLDGGASTTSASEAVPTEITAIFEHFKEMLANGEDVSSLLPEGVSPEDMSAEDFLSPDGATEIGAGSFQRRQEESESGVFTPALDGGSPTTSAADSLPTDPKAIAEKLKELLANGEDISALLPEGASPEDMSTENLLAPGGASEIGAGSFQRRQDGASASGVFTPALDGGSPTTSASGSVPTDPTAIMKKIQELLSNGEDINSALPEGMSLEDVLAGGQSGLGAIGNQRRQADDASESPSAVFTPPLDGGSSTTAAPEMPTDPVAIFEKLKELVANGEDIIKFLPEGSSPEDILGELGNQRRQEETPSAVFSPPLDGGEPTSTSESSALPTDPTKLLSKLKEMFDDGEDISSFVPEGKSPEDFLASGLADMSAMGHLRRQNDMPAVPSSILEALPSEIPEEAVEAVEGVISEGAKLGNQRRQVPRSLPTSLLSALPSEIPTEVADAIEESLPEDIEMKDVEALVSKGVEQLQGRQVPTSLPTSLLSAMPSASEMPTEMADAIEKLQARQEPMPTSLPTSLLSAIPSEIPTEVADAIEEALPEDVEMEDVEALVSKGAEQLQARQMPTSLPASLLSAIPSEIPTEVADAIEEALPENVKMEDVEALVSKGAEKLQARQEPVPTSLPTSLLSALPTEMPTQVADAIEEVLPEDVKPEDVEALIAKGAEKLQARQGVEIPEALKEILPENVKPEDVEALAEKLQARQELEIPESIKEVLPEDVKPEDVEALIAKGTEQLQARQAPEDLDDLDEALPSGLPLDDLEEMLPEEITDAAGGDLGNLELDQLPGVEEAVDALPAGIIEARSEHSGAGSLAVSGAAVLAAIGLGFAMI